MEKLLFEIQESVSLETPRQLRHALEKIINVNVPHTEVRQRIQLCLSEAVTNLAMHANPKPGYINLRFGNDSQYWWLEILDDSAPWDPTQHFDDGLLTEFTEIESGRGTALLHSQSDDITYIKGNEFKLNKLRLTWACPKQKSQQTILLVEDNNSLRLLYENYLASSYTILTATDGFEALQQLSRHKVDLIISDIQMPQMNGLTLRKKINQQTKRELIPFIFLTATDDELMQEQATELGIDDYLIKPIQKPQLMKIIRRVLGRSTQVYEQLTARIDKSISSSLEPKLPEISHDWCLAVAHRHTGSGGGDLLMHKSSETMLQLVLTDIMGHDDSAKFFAHACGGYIHGLMQSIEKNNNPAQLLEQLSNCAIEDKVLSKVTLTCCSVQLSSAGKISLASAGHPAPLLISPENIKPLNIGGVLPGLLPDTQYQSTQLTIKQGERIALYTDGLFDSAASNHARKELENKITEALIDTLNLPLEKSIEQVMRLFDEITACKPTDDALLILLEPI